MTFEDAMKEAFAIDSKGEYSVRYLEDTNEYGVFGIFLCYGMFPTEKEANERAQSLQTSALLQVSIKDNP